MQCRLCNKKPNHNTVLLRVNEKGVPGIWECSPSCGVAFINIGTALEHALNEKAPSDVTAVGRLIIENSTVTE